MTTSAACTPTPQSRCWLLVGVVVWSGVVTAIHAGKAAVATPLLQKDLGLDLAAAGWLTGIFAVLGLIGGIPAGSLVARIGDRSILLLGLALVAAGSAIGAGAPSPAALLASRVLEGLGFLFVTVAGPAILSRAIHSERRDTALALWSCFMPAGLALAMLVGPMFSEWRALWWGSAGLAAFTMAAGRLVVTAPPKRVSASWKRVISDSARVLVSKGPVLMAACFALYNLLFFALFSFLPALLMERLTIPHSTAGLLSALATGTNIVGNVAAGYLVAHGARRSMLLVSAFVVMGLSGPCIFLDVFGEMPSFLLCILFAGIAGLIPATLISSAPFLAPTPTLTPVVMGLLMQGSNLGQVVGPVAVGGAVEAYGWAAAAGIVLISALTAALAAAGTRFNDDAIRAPR